MATKKPKATQAALAADPDAVIPRMSLSETGVTGLRTVWGRIVDDRQRAFQNPQFLITVQEMRWDTIIASVFNTYRMFLKRVEWNVVPPLGATPEQIERAKFIEQCKDDMENTWAEFISDVLEYLAFGFSVQEKVFRRRLRKNGSRYNDGKIGLRKLSPRSQDTILRWDFTEDGRDLVGCEQSVYNLEYSYMFTPQLNEHGLIYIPREKFLLFTCDKTKGNPTGTSILRNVYLSYKQVKLLREQELLGVAKQVAGLPVIKLHPQYMDPAASDDKKAVFDAAKSVLDNMQNGTNRGVIFPRMVDETTKVDAFDLDILDQKGINSIDLNSMIRRYTDEILSAMSVDILKSGTNGGSFSLQDGDTSVLTIALSSRLQEIADVLNNDLIPHLFQMNGWLDEELPKFVPSDISSMSAEEFSKTMQRTGSIGLVVKDIPTINAVRKSMGIAPLPADTNVDDLEFTMASSSAGEGMKTPFPGTGTKPSGKDESTANNENAA